jgi:predicted peptidase
MHSRFLALFLAALVAACSGADITPPSDTGTPIDSTLTNPVSVGFQSKTVVDAGVSYGFQVFIPANYNTATKVPVILFMHGSGESGNDNLKQVTVGLGPVVKAQASVFPAIVVFPQSPAGEGLWPIYERIAPAALDQVMKTYKKADSTRVYLTGFSYGGVHAYSVAYHAPNRFAALVPVSATICGACLTGSASTTQAQGFQIAAATLKALPIWQFHGSLDGSISVQDARAIFAAFKSAGSSTIQYTEYAGAPHDITATVYGDLAMWTWLFAQHR